MWDFLSIDLLQGLDLSFLIQGSYPTDYRVSLTYCNEVQNYAQC